jgi:hypothetical protein
MVLIVVRVFKVKIAPALSNDKQKTINNKHFMLALVIKDIFLRDLERLRKEIAAYQDERKLWQVTDGISNSGGNLCLHLLGNLNTYIGAEMGKSGYVRNRNLEFSLKNIPQQELLERIDATTGVVDNALDSITDSQLQEEYPLLVYAEMTTTGYLLVSLVSHFGYHLGQINYHRRLLDK